MTVPGQGWAIGDDALFGLYLEYNRTNLADSELWAMSNEGTGAIDRAFIDKETGRHAELAKRLLNKLRKLDEAGDGRGFFYAMHGGVGGVLRNLYRDSDRLNALMNESGILAGDLAYDEFGININLKDPEMLAAGRLEFLLCNPARRFKRRDVIAALKWSIKRMQRGGRQEFRRAAERTIAGHYFALTGKKRRDWSKVDDNSGPYLTFLREVDRAVAGEPLLANIGLLKGCSRD